MKRIEYRTIDKSSWPDGPWKDEPDKIQWMDEATGLPCLIVRHGWSGHYCGYVGVTRDHPLFDVGYDDEACSGLSVHGGLTFSGFCQEHEPGEEGTVICHVVEPGEDDKVFWLGFDCAHYLDRPPGRPHWSDGEVYRDQAYVVGEVENLASQLKERASGQG